MRKSCGYKIEVFWFRKGQADNICEKINKFCWWVSSMIRIYQWYDMAQPNWAYEFPYQTGLDTQICSAGPAGPE